VTSFIDMAAASSASTLNRECLCATINTVTLEHELTAALGDNGLWRTLGDTHPHLFSATAVFVTPQQVEQMRAVVEAIDTVIATDVYRRDALARAPATALHDPRTPGVFLGYDFHLGEHGPQLIEINTNAGGGLLNVYLARAQTACCPEMHGLTAGPVDLTALEDRFVDMFRHEWRLARGDLPLKRIAVVDDTPSKQYLYPEFKLFQSLFRRHDIDALIAAPDELVLRGNRIRHVNGAVDLVYNRLTDFSLLEPAHASLHTAWLDDLALFTPHPRAHALYADKRNLIPLTNLEWLRTAGINPAVIATLRQGIAHTRLVERAQAEELWAARKQLFFKPAGGFGSKAVYRGDKLTRRVWEEILAGDYVAQALVPPGERQVQVGAKPAALKYDVRCFVYAGKVQLVAARLYQGQAMNFRTPGGGFAPVFYPPAMDGISAGHTGAVFRPPPGKII